MPDPVIAPAQVGVEEKQTNRVFTQSEYDKAIADHEKAVVEKFKDYETLKQKADAFEKEKADAEISKLSEIEKANKKAQELEARLNEVESEKNILVKQTLKLSVLSDSKYSILPEPYRKLIDGEDEKAIKENADKAVLEFNEYLKKIGVPLGNAGLPPSLNNNNKIPDAPQNAVITALKKRFGEKGD